MFFFTYGFIPIIFIHDINKCRFKKIFFSFKLNSTKTVTTNTNCSEDFNQNIKINKNKFIHSNDDNFNVFKKHNSVLKEFENLTKECFEKQKQVQQEEYFKTSQKSLNELKNSIIGKAIVINDHTPSPYDRSSLTIKVRIRI